MASGKISFAVEAQRTGATFTANDPAKFRDGGQTKKKAQFGVINEAKGPTIDENSTHIPTPNADVAPLKNKVIAETSGQGEYEPEKASGQVKAEAQFGGSVGVTGHKKSGKSMPIKHGFKS